MPLTSLCFAQGLFYVLTGLWPLVSMGTFVAVTGPKTDLWLVRTVGVLVTVIGAVLVLAGARHAINLEIRILAMGTAFLLAAIDVIYASVGRISKIYWLDAVVELGLVAAWIFL